MQAQSRASFQQAGIPIVKLEAFEQLRSAIARVFAKDEVEGFLKLLRRKGVPVRDFERVRREGLIEHTDRSLMQSGTTAQQLYDSLTTSDQAQMREFYLTALETVDPELRQNFSKLYRYD